MLSSWREAFCKQNHTVKRQKTPELRTGEAEEVPGEVMPQSSDTKLRGRLWEARLGARARLPASSAVRKSAAPTAREARPQGGVRERWAEPSEGASLRDFA